MIIVRDNDEQISAQMSHVLRDKRPRASFNPALVKKGKN